MAAIAQSGVEADDRHHQYYHQSSKDQNTDLHRDMKELVDFLSKLNPSAKEFFPSSYSPPNGTKGRGNSSSGADQRSNGVLSADAPLFVCNHEQKSNNQRDSSSDGSSNGYQRRRNSYNHVRRRKNDKVRRYQKEDRIRRTVYVAEIDQHVTEEDLAALFFSCGPIEDCRACGDPHSVLRFAFIEFADERGARAALNLNGTMLGYYPVKVLPSKTAILPVNPQYLPQSLLSLGRYANVSIQYTDYDAVRDLEAKFTKVEKEMCTRTVYCTNIDKKITQLEVKAFFESTCGTVSRLRLLGDNVHSTHIAFVEFVLAESALHALSRSGAFLGALPIRVSPSKTPVRSQVPRGVSQ